MNRRSAWLGGAVGAFAVWKWFRRKPKPAIPMPDPAEALRAKLEESRAVVGEREEFEAGETTVDAAPDPESRRRGVHEQARRRIDELRGE
ncbi:MAG: hypothetical protein ACYDA3_05060 [Gaiellaceae bacterium]